MVVLPCPSKGRGALLSFSHPLLPHACHFPGMDLSPCAQQR